MDTQFKLEKPVTIYDLFLQQKFTDIDFDCQNGTIGAHFPIVAAHCMRIKQRKGKQIVMLNYPKDLVKGVLELLYKGEKQYKVSDMPSVLKILNYLDCSYTRGNTGSANGEMEQMTLNNDSSHERSITPDLNILTSQVRNGEERIQKIEDTIVHDSEDSEDYFKDHSILPLETDYKPIRSCIKKSGDTSIASDTPQTVIENIPDAVNKDRNSTIEKPFPPPSQDSGDITQINDEKILDKENNDRSLDDDSDVIFIEDSNSICEISDTELIIFNDVQHKIEPADIEDEDSDELICRRIKPTSNKMF